MTPDEALRRVFGTAPYDADWFTPAFLQALPLARLHSLATGLMATHGPLEGVDGSTVRLQGASIPAEVALENGRIAGLWLHAPVPQGGVATQLDALRALPGRTAALVLTDGQEVAAHEADSALSVGSVFKLALLEALRAGRVDEAEVVRLRAPWRSLPTGILQSWPEGVPVTVGTLAALMASMSDNTAADALLAVLGRGAAEAVSPRNTPFPSTREVFAILADPMLRAAWTGGDAAARRRVLVEVAAHPLPTGHALPAAPEVGWHMTLREVCALLDTTHGMAALRINPGPVPPGWDAVAYKGGSQPGAMCLAAWVAAGSVSHTVAVAWNDTAPLQEDRLVGVFRGLLGALRE